MLNNSTSYSKKISIFKFDNTRDYLMAAGFPDGTYNGQSNTLQKWSNRLGYRSPSSLNMVLKGSRFPSRDMQRALIKDLELNSKESEYFELLIEKEKLDKKGNASEEILIRLESLSGGKKSYQVPIKEFSLVSKWYFLVIKQLVGSSEFIEDLDWINRKLRKRVSKRNIEQALVTLEELKLIERDDNGVLRPSEKPIKMENGTSRSALQSHHGGMIEQSFHALTDLPPEKRQICALTLKMPNDRLQEAQNYLMKMLEEFDQKFFTEDAAEVYQLNLQLFPHTNEGTQS